MGGNADLVDGYDAFVLARHVALRRYGYVLSGSVHDGDDLAQEALVRLRSAWGRVRLKENPEQYVRKTMVHLYLSWIRRRKRELILATAPDRPSLDQQLEAVGGEPELWQALDRLGRRQRAVLVMRYFEELSDEEIAARMDITPSTVRSQRTRAFAAMRVLLGSEYASMTGRS